MKACILSLTVISSIVSSLYASGMSQEYGAYVERLQIERILLSDKRDYVSQRRDKLANERYVQANIYSKDRGFDEQEIVNQIRQEKEILQTKVELAQLSCI